MTHAEADLDLWWPLAAGEPGQEVPTWVAWWQGELSHLHCLAGELRHIHSVGELRHLHSVEVITTQFRHSSDGSVMILHPSATSCQSQQSSTEPNPATDLTGGSPPPPGLLPTPLPPPGEGLAEGLPQLQQRTSGAEENGQ